MTQTPALPELSPLATYIESDIWRDAWGAWISNINSDPATLMIYLHQLSGKGGDIAAKLVERFK